MQSCKSRHLGQSVHILHKFAVLNAILHICACRCKGQKICAKSVQVCSENADLHKKRPSFRVWLDFVLEFGVNVSPSDVGSC